jgi:hypothetical protein
MGDKLSPSVPPLAQPPPSPPSLLALHDSVPSFPHGPPMIDALVLELSDPVAMQLAP